MNPIDFAPTRLRRGAMLRIRDGEGRSIAVFGGLVWITQEGDPRDVFIAGGQSRAQLVFDCVGPLAKRGALIGREADKHLRSPVPTRAKQVAGIRLKLQLRSIHEATWCRVEVDREVQPDDRRHHHHLPILHAHPSGTCRLVR